MRVYLMQHGEAKAKDEDPDRHLTDQGQRDVQGVAALLRPLRLTAEAVWHSGKPRAAQTADALAAGMAVNQGVQARDLGADDDVQPVRDTLEGSRSDVAIVGHQPFLGKLSGLLVSGSADRPAVRFQYGAVACLEKQDGSWQVAWMVVPPMARP